jgi:hypothetical protein
VGIDEHKYKSEEWRMATDFSATTDMIIALLPVIVMFMLIGVIVGALGNLKFGK